MTEPPDQWLSLSEAAIQLGIAENAVRSRIKRRTIRARKDNHGRLMVCLCGTEDRTRTMVRTWTEPGSDHTTEPMIEPSIASDMVPAAMHREIVAELQAALKRQEAAFERQEAAFRDQIVRERAQYREMIEMWREWSDAAEIRAEQANESLRSLVDKITAAAPHSWWARWRWW